MKKSLLRHIFSFVLALCLLVGFSAKIYADAHVHVFNFAGYVYSYNADYDDDGEILSTHTVCKLKLTMCDCGVQGQATVVANYTEPHGDTELRFSGTHYHFGNTQTHIAVYNVCCVLCGGVTGTYLDRYSCPGNGACIAP